MTEAGSEAWRTRRLEALLGFAARSRVENGFGRLGRDGVPHGERRELWINARMTYVFSAATIRGGAAAAPALAAHGVEALSTLFADREHGGWHSAVSGDGQPLSTAKSCYDHAFVLLAACVARAAGVPGAEALLVDAADVHLTRFWSEEGRCVDECSPDWSETSSYRGANANMHTVEAYLAADHVTGDPAWLERATRIAGFFVDTQARAHSWRIPEHYDARWRPELEHNADRVGDPFRPYGATPGHGLEWARLLLEIEARLDAPPAWLLEGARALVDRVVADVVTQTPGLPYTTDWEGRVVTPARFHWVMAEAVQTADALHARTGEASYLALRERWWDEIDRWFVVGDTGLWNHELDEHLAVAGHTWPDAPDAYHAANALAVRPWTSS